LLEVVIVMTILAISLSLFGTTLGASLRLDPVGREKAIAAEAARSKLEEMRNHPFSQMFALYNDTPLDDPGGVGTAPGSCFSVQDLDPTSAGACIGRITFPTVKSQLREDVDDDNLGTPRDLNGDGVVDEANHAADFLILPIRVTLEWAPTAGKGGKRNFTLYTMFSAL
jgi:type II secretory pathway pseudopilin PulG